MVLVGNLPVNSRSSNYDYFRRFRLTVQRNYLGALGGVMVLVLLVVALAAPVIAPYDPLKLNFKDKFLPPSLAHPFGTDTLGRDVFSRVITGSRISLRLGFMVLVIAVSVGMVVGSLAGYLGGLTDELMMRVTDIFLAFPPLILALAVNAGLGPGLTSAMLAVSVTWWPSYARMVRGQVLSIKQRDYVEAARSIGCPSIFLLLRHILPNAINPIIVQISLDMGYVVLITAGLSFVGLGAQPPTPEWGAMVTEGKQSILTQWWWATFPGLAICYLVVGFNLLGDFLQDLLDPQRSRVVN